jgi:hypothetical protein
VKDVGASLRCTVSNAASSYIFGGFCSVLWIGVIIFFICWTPLGDPNPAPYNHGLAILVLIVIFLQASFLCFPGLVYCEDNECYSESPPCRGSGLREGKLVKVPSTDLVAGDIVRFSIGDKVPADTRLLSTSSDAGFDRSMLTSESNEVEGATDIQYSQALGTCRLILKPNGLSYYLGCRLHWLLTPLNYTPDAGFQNPHYHSSLSWIYRFETVLINSCPKSNCQRMRDKSEPFMRSPFPII